MDLAGATCALAYGWLALLSRAEAPVDLGRFFVAMGIAWAGALAGFFAVRRASAECSFRRVLAWAALFRLIALWGQPVLEDDFYRYLWDGRSFALHGTPYADRPYDHFDDPDVPPRFQWILSNINHPDVPTIYGPLCQYVFLLAYGIAPGALLPIRLLLVGADLLAAWLLRRLARADGLLLYAWCPLLIQEIGFSAHLEALAIVCAVGALRCALDWRAGALTAFLCALAVGARLHALLLVPFLIPLEQAGLWALFALALAALYLPFWLHGTVGEAGGLFAFFRDWEFNSSGYALLASGLGSGMARGVSAALFVLVYAAMLHGHRRARPRAGLPRGDRIYGALFLLAPVVNPWYLAWLAPFVALRPSLWGMTALATVTLSHAHGLNLPGAALAAFQHPAWVRPVEFGLVALAAGADFWRHRAAAYAQPHG